MVIEEAKHQIEDVQAPYGYYFARRDNNRELRLTGAEIGLLGVALHTTACF